MAEGRRTTTSLTETGRRCLLPIHPEARVYGLPIISGHVGADAAACMLAVDLGARRSAGRDHGHRHQHRAHPRQHGTASSRRRVRRARRSRAARSPAACRASTARSRTSRSTTTGRSRLGVIGGGAPEGICGSGLVDLLSELLRTGRMNDMGRFEDGVDAIHARRRRTASTSSRATSTSWRRRRAPTSPACRSCSATTASRSTTSTCSTWPADSAGISKKEASRRIGLIPNLPDAKIVQVGNAAIEGACIALLSVARREALEALVRRVEHCRLETHPEFFDFFVEGCQFKPVAVGESGDVDDRAHRHRARTSTCSQPSTSGCSAIPRDWVVGDRAARARATGRATGTRSTDGRGSTPAKSTRWRSTARRVDARRRRRSRARGLRRRLQTADAHGAVLVAVSAGPELEARGAEAAGRTGSPTSTSSSRSTARPSSSIWSR